MPHPDRATNDFAALDSSESYDDESDADDHMDGNGWPRHPGLVPSVSKGNGLTIRHYREDDAPYLMELERLAPRGEPRPFVHFRRQFIDRAMMFRAPYLFIAEKDNRPVGVTSIAIKDTGIGDDAVRLAYSFDTRVHPGYRRQGIANALQEEKIKFLHSEGVHGMYACVVATNVASLAMLEKVGFHRARMILHLTYSPLPLIIPPPADPEQYDYPVMQDLLEETFGNRDMYQPDLAEYVADFNFQQFILEDNGHIASMSIFDQSLVYQQVSADEPWPDEADIARRGRNWRIFDEVGIYQKELLKVVFDYVRDLAIVSNVSKLTWIIDRSDPVPGFVFNEATHQKDYWVMFRPLAQGWMPNWSGTPIYIDARDL
jgi:ribosomal protein S18 acetylase RimI-like enzyme